MSVEWVGEDAVELTEDRMIVADGKHRVLVIALVVREPEQPIADQGSASAGPALAPCEERCVGRPGIAAQAGIGSEVMIPVIQERRTVEGVGALPRHDVDGTRPGQAGPRLEVESGNLKLLDRFL